ncbi:unnamed protein product, partial [Prunus brigantina]
MVDTRRTKSNATTTGPSHGFVVETSMQPHGIPPHDPGTSIALQSPAPITGAALPRCPAVGAQQQPHHSTTGLAAQTYGYSDVVLVLEQIHSLPPLRSHLTYAPGAQGDRPLGTEEEVSQSRSRHRRRRHGTSTLRAEDVEKLVNDQLREPFEALQEHHDPRYALWDDDRIAAKKASKQVDHPTKQASQKSNKFEQEARDKRRSRPQEGSSETGTFTEFAIPIHQILAQVKDKPWVRRPPPMKGDPSKRDTSKYCAFHGEHGHYTNNCNAWKGHLEELVREGHCTKFVAKKAIQQIEDRDAAAKEPPQKVIRINTILADSQESGLTTKERKRKIAQATYVSQVTTGVPAMVDTPIIGFQKDLIGLDLPHNDALVI